ARATGAISARSSNPSSQWFAIAELEAEAVHGLDGASAIGGGKLCADVANVAVDGAGGHLDVQLIGRRHDLFAVEERGRPCQNRAQDAEFDGREPQRDIAEPGQMPL